MPKVHQNGDGGIGRRRGRGARVSSSLAEINDHIKRLLIPMKDAAAKKAIMQDAIVPWRDQTGCEWDAAKQAYVPPKEPEPQQHQDFDSGGDDEPVPF